MRNWNRFIGFILIAAGVDHLGEFLKEGEVMHLIIGLCAVALGALKSYENQEDEKGE